MVYNAIYFRKNLNDSVIFDDQPEKKSCNN